MSRILKFTPEAHIKPCPICGSSRVFIEEIFDRYFIFCDDCGFRGTHGCVQNVKGPMAEWNGIERYWPPEDNKEGPNDRP